MTSTLNEPSKHTNPYISLSTSRSPQKKVIQQPNPNLKKKPPFLLSIPLTRIHRKKSNMAFTIRAKRFDFPLPTQRTKKERKTKNNYIWRLCVRVTSRSARAEGEGGGRRRTRLSHPPLAEVSSADYRLCVGDSSRSGTREPRNHMALTLDGSSALFLFAVPVPMTLKVSARNEISSGFD